MYTCQKIIVIFAKHTTYILVCQVKNVCKTDENKPHNSINNNEWMNKILQGVA